MDLANMREQGVRHLIAFCHNNACRRQAVIDLSKYPGDTLVSWFKSKIKHGKCGGNALTYRRIGRGAGNVGELDIGGRLHH
jgi:hypothetical protein